MQVESKKLDKNQVELTIQVSHDELKPFLERGAKKLAEQAKVAGFRPGHVPYDVLKKEYGEMAIYESALEDAVRHTYTKAVEQEGLQTVSHPKIEVEKLAPQNDLVYKATVALMPEVKLGDYKSLSVKRDKKEVKDEDVDKALKNLSKMQTKEAAVDREVQKSDKVNIDMEMFLDKVPVEGGQSKGQSVYMDEDLFIPGFNEKLLGQKKGETREFKLKFPGEHYQKNLAGKNVDFKVKVNDVFELQYPEMNDEFAKTLGQQSMDELKKLIKENMGQEAKMHEEQKAERAMLEKLVEQSEFGEIPEVLLEAEIEKMLMELKENVARQGMDFEEYLNNVLKKKPEELKKEFLPEAYTRVKTALVMREVAEKEGIKADEKEIEEEVNKMLEAYKDNEEVKKQIQSPAGKEYLANLIRNRKIIEFLKKNIISD